MDPAAQPSRSSARPCRRSSSPRRRWLLCCSARSGASARPASMNVARARAPRRRVPRGSGPAGASARALTGSFVVDGFAKFMKGLTLIGAAAGIVMSPDYLRREGIDRFEFPILIVLSTIGMLMVISANDLIALYLGLELLSLSSYVDRRLPPRQPALDRGRPEVLRARRALLGHAPLRRVARLRLHRHGLLPGDRGGPPGQASGTASSSASSSSRPASPSRSRPCRSTCGRRTSTRARRPRSRPSSRPRRRWPAWRWPCASSSTPSRASSRQWQQIIVFISIASMALGSFAAIGQRNIKRLMAYSSIGNVGYALIGLAAGTAGRRPGRRASTWRSTSP